MSSEKIRVGAIGTGGCMTGHLKSLAERPEVELVALVDPAQASIERMQKNVPQTAGARVFSDYRAMLQEMKLDGVVICSPHTLHLQQVLDCLDKGLHVLCEKPLVCSVADTHKVIEKSRKTKRHVVVGYQRRFAGNYRCMREFVRDQAFGQPLFVQAYQSQYWYKNFLTAWRTDPALSGGGQINDSGSHLVDMLFWIMPSRPVEVTALMQNRGTRVDVDSAISFRFADGCLGNLSIHGSGPRAAGFVEDISITSDSGRAVYLREGRITLSLGTELVEVKTFRGGANKSQHWLDVILGKEENQSPPEEFLPTIAFTEACWKSAAQGGRPVQVMYE
jgi:predicted dehydrogenase